MTHDFTLVLNREPSENELDALFEAGCDDSTPEGELIHFDREGRSLAAAIASAVRDVEKVPGLEAVGVVRDDAVTLLDIARRTQRTYESVRLLAAGQRGPGRFPEPRLVTTGGERVWDWPDVAAWLRDELGQQVETPPPELALADRTLSVRHALRVESDEATREELSELLKPAC